MRQTCLYLIIGATLLSGCVSVQKTERPCEQPAVCPLAQKDEPCQVLRHVVLFKFKDDTSAAKVREIESAFAALPSKIDTICDFEWGTDVSVENRSMGFTHCFVVTFKDEEGRAAYLPHPAHKQFGQILGPHLDKVCVVDYWAK